MNYKVGDKVKIKSLEWYNQNKDENGFVRCGDKVFDDYMSVFCGSVVTICGIVSYCGYDVREDMQCRSWTDGMIECLVEPAPDNKINEIISRANKAVIDSFEDGAKFERERLAKEVESWLKDHYFDDKYWSGDGEDFNLPYFSEDLKNLILGKE